LELLESLRAASSVLEFDTSGDPPDRYTLMFRGKGIARDASPHADVELVELHRVDLRLPYAYPQVPPDIRWASPVFHPNISFSGFIHLRDVGLPWDASVTLDVVCERLWDVARAAYKNVDRATNISAKKWYEQQHRLRLPVDARPLRDKARPSASNVVRYRRRGQRMVELPPSGENDDVLFIGEDTPTPPLPKRGRVRGSDNDDDVLYIGDD
jgi:hypothetical protein